MTTMSTNSFSGLTRPDDIQKMLFQPIEDFSAAGFATTFTTTKSKTWRVPAMTEDPNAAWTPEGEEIDVSTPAVAEVEVTPRKIAGLTAATSELLADSDEDVAAAVGAGLARDISRKIDQALFAPTTPEHGPAGLGAISPTLVPAPEAWEDVDPFTLAVYGAEVGGASITGWFANPADARALATVKEGQGSARGLLTPDPTQAGARLVEGVPVHVSNAVTPGEIWGLDQTQIFTVIRQDAEVVSDRSAFFTSDRVAIRATMRVGFGFINPSGVVKIVRGE